MHLLAPSLPGPLQVDTYMQRVVDCLKASPSITDVEISAGQPCLPASISLTFAA